MNQPEAQDTGDDQKDRYDVIEQLRHDQDEDAGEQRDDRLDVCDPYGAYGHFFIPCIVVFASRRRAKWSRAITLPPNNSTGIPRMNPELAASSETLDAASEAVHRSIHLLGCVKTRLLILQPIVDLLAHRVFADAGVFLNLAFKLFALAGNFVEIVIRKMTPLLLDLAFELLPVAFDAIPIHCKLLLFQRRGKLWLRHLASLTVIERSWFQHNLGVTSRTRF
jgi:hypothetical protein